jgi:hypothetical protein
MRLFCDRVLICEDCAWGVRRATLNRVDGGHDGEKVLEFVEVVRNCGDSSIEGVEERGVEGSEREFRDDVWEVEYYPLSAIDFQNEGYENRE